MPKIPNAINPQDILHKLLSRQAMTAKQLVAETGLSQATISRYINRSGAEIIRFGTYQTIHYALHRPSRLGQMIPLYCIQCTGQISLLGKLFPVYPQGFVLQEATGKSSYSEGLPWCLIDMRPQGFLGRAYVARYAEALGLPTRLNDWQDDDVLHALMMHGDDVIGNLLVGKAAQQRFIHQVAPSPVEVAANYVAFAQRSSAGELPGSSAGGEQPKFTTSITSTDEGQAVRHVLVKYALAHSPASPNPIAERWADLLLAEHLALSTLRQHGIPAVASRVLDHAQQRFLELERFDRVGATGRRGVCSLAALDNQFIGIGSGWPMISSRLSDAGHISKTAQQQTCLLYAFGTLIGNTDMHTGNLSFITDSFPYALAPAYDMLPMAFAPRTSGELPSQIPPARIVATVPNAIWQHALLMAQAYLRELQANPFSRNFAPCLLALERHLIDAAEKIELLGK